MTKPYSLIIIGSGPAGLTAAIYAARANLSPLIIDGNNPGGQLMGTSLVENWPGENSILGPKLMENMRKHAEHFGTQFLADEIKAIDLKKQPFTLTLSSGKTLLTQALIVATGATPKKLGCPGEAEYWGKGVTTCATCDAPFYRDKKVIVVGGGDTAMEDAHFLRKFTDDITVVHILDTLTANFSMQQRVINDPKIKVIYNSTVTQITGNNGHVTSAVVTNQKTKEATKLDTDGIFVAIGLTPNTNFLKGQLDLDPYGYITLKGNTTTSIPGVFAAGDVADYRYRQAITSAGSGCMAALDAEKYLKEVEKA